MYFIFMTQILLSSNDDSINDAQQRVTLLHPNRRFRLAGNVGRFIVWDFSGSLLWRKKAG